MRGRYFRPNRTRNRPWHERNPDRFCSDRALVAEYYPSLSLYINEESSAASLQGDITIREECGISTSINTLIQFPPGYPTHEPEAYDAKRRFQPWPERELKERHITNNGKCCLWIPPRSPWVPSDPEGLKHYLDQLAIFFERQLIYDVNGKWPGPAYAHELEGYIEFIKEELGAEAIHFEQLLPVVTMRSRIGPNEPCPCGSGSKYKKCHLRLVERIQGKIGTTAIWQLFPLQELEATLPHTIQTT